MKKLLVLSISILIAVLISIGLLFSPKNEIISQNPSSILIFDDEIGKGETFPILALNRTYRVKTLYINKDQSTSDIDFLRQEIERDLIDIGVVEKDKSIYFFF